MQRFSLLLVEDNPVDARLVGQLLAHSVFELIQTDSLRAALDTLSQRTPDVILLDLGLTDSNGLPTLKSMIQAAPEIPIVVLTSESDENLGMTMVREGAQDYLVKGAFPAQFLSRLLLHATERKRTEVAKNRTIGGLEREVAQRTQELARINQILNEAGRIARVGGWGLDALTRELTWTAATRNIHEVGEDFEPDLETAVAFYAPEAVPIISEAVRLALSEGRPFDLELPFVTARKQRLWVRAIGEPYRENGEIVRIGGVFQDITQLKLAREEAQRSRESLENLVRERTAALEESRARLAEAQFMAHLGNWEWDVQADLIRGSDEFYRLYSSDPENLRCFQDFLGKVHHDDRERVNLAIRDCIARKGSFKLEYRVLLPWPEHRHIRSQGKCVAAEDPAKIRVVSSCLDFTEQKQEEEDRFRRETLLTTLLDSSGDIIIFALDRNYCYTAFNEKHRQEMRKIFDVDIALGMCVLDAIPIASVRESARKTYDRVLAGEKFSEVVPQGNSDNYYEFYWCPITVPGGGVQGLVAFVRNVSELMKADKQIRTHLEELRRWQDVMLGRENRVQELKKEVNDLCRRLNESVRYPSQEPAPENSVKNKGGK